MVKEKVITNNELLKLMIKGFGDLEKKFDTKFEKNDKRFDKLTIEVINIKEALKEKANRKDLATLKDEIMTVLDNMSKKSENHESEHIANLGAHFRMQKEINETRQKIGLKIKSVAV